MTPKQFAKFLARDGSCWHCGLDTDLIPHHRMNRGMGGSKAREEPSNVIVMCSMINGLMESDPIMAQMAREFGWKLESWQKTSEVPVFDVTSGVWYLIKGFEREKHDF
jgi:hypothetical protein